MKLKWWALVIWLLPVFSASATHIRSAEIRVEQVNCDTRTVKITVRVFLDSRSRTLFGGTTRDDGQIQFGDGSYVIIPETQGTPRPDLGPDVSTASFTVNHTYAREGTYKITYRERDRSSGVMNMSNPGDTAYASSTTITLSDELGCNHFPTLNILPVDRACAGKKFFHNSGATDADGDSLSYALTIPSQDSVNFVVGYRAPDNPFFYTNYNTGNEAANGPPSFTVDPETGMITWDAPGRIGEYNIAFAILEWRKNLATDHFELLSTTIRDMQILVEECENERPEITIPANICVVAGTVITAKILGTDPEKNPVKIEAVSEIFSLPPAKIPATISPATVEFRPSDPPDEVDFEWKTNCVHVRDQVYQVVFKITDQPRFGTPLVTFKTWTIKVIAPKPQWAGSGLDLVSRKAVLHWKPYDCANTSAIQIWRKVGSYPYTPGVCDAGLPRFLGYQLLAEVNPSETTYTDDNNGRGLVVGAQYCYRIVAAFLLPAGGKSYVTEEMCVGPIQVDAPVITHVTVEKTKIENGNIRVSWRSPFEINPVQFPKPYHYEIYRGEGLTSQENLLKVSEQIPDTTFLDTSVNTADHPYNYHIVVYAIPQGYTTFQKVDTSAIASSVRLEATPGLNQIELTWDADVPWSNVVPSSPYHRIYRGDDTDDPEQFRLIDSVNVTVNGFMYTDTGLEEDVIYSYRVETRGTYGHPAIAQSKNFSQTVSLYPVNTLVPCKPTAHAVLPDCEAYLQAETCLQSKFESSVSWTPSLETGCRRDIVSYQVFAANGPDEEFTLIASDVRDTVYHETDLPAFARCYRIIAVDGAGQLSEWSDATCTDNCTNFMLPNIFTPNGDGCNDVYSAYSVNSGAPIPGGECQGTTNVSCPRFVEQVDFTVYNRWGRPVYSYSSAPNKSVSIDWDGHGDNGNQLESGEYFYVADVIFQVIDESRKTKKYKGWIHLLR